MVDVLCDLLGPVSGTAVKSEEHDTAAPASTRVRCGGHDIKYDIGICQ